MWGPWPGKASFLTVERQTQSSCRTRGIHDVREEITWEGRPDLIVHDSGGFEAGGDDEIQAIEAFLKNTSTAEDILARVHVIWFCIDINSSRTLQTATEKLFVAVSKYAREVPVLVVATKKDDFLDVRTLFDGTSLPAYGYAGRIRHPPQGTEERGSAF